MLPVIFDLLADPFWDSVTKFIFLGLKNNDLVIFTYKHFSIYIFFRMRIFPTVFMPFYLGCLVLNCSDTSNFLEISLHDSNIYNGCLKLN